jgi:PhnB protein
MVVLNPYLSFNGNAEEALNFYKGVFGGEVEISRFSDFPPNPDMPMDEAARQKVMHSVLKADGLQLMLSDAMRGSGVKVGDNISISLSGDDKDALTKYFEGLSQGGNVTQPLETHPWGDTFGMLVDKYGINWLVNITAAAKQ